MDVGDGIVFFAIFASLLGGPAVYFALRRWQSHRNSGLVAAAARLGGTVPEGDGLDLLTVQFTIEGRPASVEFEKGEECRTRVKVAIRHRSPGAVRIMRQSVARANGALPGGEVLKIGHPGFDREWSVTARPAALARRIFWEERRDLVVESVLRIGRYGAPSIEITRDTLVVRANGLLTREEDVMALARTAIDFVGYVFRLGPDEGIAWLSADAGETGLCPVCTNSLVERVVYCDRCRTPQHEECWVYVGQCSTYACKGKRFVA